MKLSLLDSGATRHMTPCADVISDVTPVNYKVEIADGHFIDAVGIGTVRATR
jgi:hypothetical protein